MRNHLTRTLVLAVWATAALAQIPRGSGTVVVEARDALTQAPMAGTGVRLQGGQRGVGTFTMMQSTDGEGSVRFPELPAGDYHVTCERPGYLAGASETVRLDSGEVIERIIVRLTPYASIEGAVFDEEGQPMERVTVYARPVGRVSLAPQEHTTTDRAGRYRIVNLPPGDYRIEARVPYNLRQDTVKRKPDSGEVFGYPATAYHPVGDAVESAIAVQLTAGVSLPRIDVRLRRVPLVTFSGRLLDRRQREPMTGMRLELVDPKSPYNDTGLAARPTADDGGFRFDLLQPGRYNLAIYQGSGSLALPTLIPIDIGKAGIAGLTVVPPPNQRVTVRVAPLPDGAAWEGSVRLHLEGAGSSREVEVNPGDETIVDDMPPGEWRLVARSRATQGERKLAVASLVFGFQDALVAPITIAESGNPVLELTLTAATGGVAGVFEGDGRGRPELALLRRSGTTAVDMALVSSDGSFRFTDLAPGVYEVSTGNNGQFSFAPASGPVKVEVRTGQTSSIKLAAVR